MARKETKDTRRRITGTRRRRAVITRMNIPDMMKKKAATKNPATTRPIRTRSITKAARRRRKESTDTRNSTRRDRRPQATTKKPTRMNITKSTNSTMISTKRANIR